jgi:TetR/AcrR family transcriptional regulator
MSVLGRRTYLRADQRKQQILEIAKDVFAKRGVREANVADICEAAKIGRGTLYQYFENKNDLLRAVMDGIGDRIIDTIAKRPPVAAIPGIAGAPIEMIVAFCTRRVRQILDVIFADQATLRLVLREAHGLDGAVDKALARIDTAMLGAMEADMRAAQNAGILRADLDPPLAARFVLGGVEKVVLTALAGDLPVDLDSIVKATVEIQLFGMLKHREAKP